MSATNGTLKNVVLDLAKSVTAPDWRNVELSADASIEILFRPPSLADQLAALGSLETGMMREFELRSRIADWRGVFDPAGQPVPYSWHALSVLCETFPDTLFELLKQVRQETTGSEGEGEGDRQKKSDEPLPVGGTEATVETVNPTVS